MSLIQQLSAINSPTDSTSPDARCAQRFFSQGKRIPKDVKRHCGMCRQHGVFVETRGHNCTFRNCDCDQCQLVRKRREIMSTQIRLRREQDKKFQRTTDVNEADIVPWSGEIGEDKIPENVNLCYFCQKCKNHGILMWKKDHKKKCKFIDCRCVQCDLIDSRRALDRYIKKRKMNKSDDDKLDTISKSPRKDEMNNSSNCSSEESSSSSDYFSSAAQSAISLNLPQGSPSLGTPAKTTPASSPFETTSPLLAPSAQTNNNTTTTLSFFSVPSLLSPMMPTSARTTTSPTLFPLGFPPFYGAVNIFANSPFFMPTAVPSLNMQMLFSSIQSLNEMTAAVTLANSD